MNFSSFHIISASAGSGKTFQLTKRYLELLFSGEDFANIVAVTFTENAAKEMKERIIGVLKSAATGKKEALEIIGITEKKEIEKRARQIVDEIFERYNQFNVRTIDSFITSIFTSSSFELGYHPDFEIRFSYHSAVEEIIFGFLSGLIISGKTRLIDEFVDFLNKTSSFYFDPTPKITSYISSFFEKEDFYLSEIYVPGSKKEKIYKKKLTEISGKIFKKVEKLINRYGKEAFYSAVYQSFENKNIYELTKKAVSSHSIFKDKQLKGSSQDKELLDLCKDYLKLRAFTYYTPYINMFERFRDYFRKRSIENGFCVLSSLSKDIKGMLENERSVFICETFMRMSSVLKHFMIDEFQDTSYSQWSIIRVFIEESLSRGGSCFLIGDIKQAIYMFRNADYKIMKNIIENQRSTDLIDLSSCGDIKLITLDKNYRSSKSVLDYVNRFFNSDCFKDYLKKNSMDEFVDLYSVEHKPTRDEEGYVRTVMVTKEKLHDELIDTLKDILKRYPNYSVAILSYKNDILKNISGWFFDEKIDCISYSELDIRENTTVNAVINLMRFINNQNDEFSFAKFVMSNVFISDKKKTNDIHRLFIRCSLNKTSKVEEFKKTFPDLWERFIKPVIEKSRQCDVYSLINFIYSLYTIPQRFPSDSGYLVKLLDLCLSVFREENVYSLSDFIDFIDSTEEDDERFQIDLSFNADAVRLMTFHKSKGLEFDVVINVFIESGTGGGEKIYYDFKNGSIKLYALNSDIAKSDNELKKIYDSHLIENKVSEINTVYVALTRAKREMYNIVVNLRENSTGILSLFREVFSCNDVYEIGKKSSLKTDSYTKKDNFVFEVISTDKSFPALAVPSFDKNIFIGKIYHRAVSFILTENIQQNKAIKKAFIFENIRYDKSIEIEVKKLIKKTFSDHNFLNLFNGKKIKTEIELFTPDKELVRIDMIAEDEKSATVVDFKTGIFKHEYYSQVKKYIKALAAVFNKKELRGFIYYPDKRKIINVNEDWLYD